MSTDSAFQVCVRCLNEFNLQTETNEVVEFDGCNREQLWLY